MSFLSRLSPIRAYKDLRNFILLRRSPYELGFLALAVVITAGFFFAFFRDSKEKRVYRPQIQYVQQWPLDRTDAQIRAQQTIDQAAKDKRLAAEAAERETRRAQFKRLDDKLKAYGF